MNSTPVEHYFNYTVTQTAQLIGKKKECYGDNVHDMACEVNVHFPHYKMFSAMYKNVTSVWCFTGMVNGDIAYLFFVVHLAPQKEEVQEKSAFPSGIGDIDQGRVPTDSAQIEENIIAYLTPILQNANEQAARGDIDIVTFNLPWDKGSLVSRQSHMPSRLTTVAIGNVTKELARVYKYVFNGENIHAPYGRRIGPDGDSTAQTITILLNHHAELVKNVAQLPIPPQPKK